MRIHALVTMLALLPTHAWADDDEQPDPPEEEETAPPPNKPEKAPVEETPEPEAKAEVTAKATAGSNEVQPKTLTLSVELLGAAPLDRGNRDLFSNGGGGSIGGEYYVAPMLGIHAGATFLALPAGDGMDSTSWIAGHAGPRLHLGGVVFGEQTHHDVWVDAHVTYGTSGGIARPGFDAGAAFQWEVSPAIRIGPAIRYQFGSDPRDKNAQVFTIGVAAGFGGRTRVPMMVTSDRDRDGLADADDQCPDDPPGDYPDPKRAGCPGENPDLDGDGIANKTDQCPTEPVGKKPDPAREGCPFVDRDGDGIADAFDKCPDEPGPPNAFEPSKHGCGELARVTATKIEILQQIFFETDSATIKEESSPVLNAVAAILKKNTKLRVRVEGHTDNQGDDAYNLDLSKRRARSVATWLITNGGIDAGRFETEGYGKTRPVVSGSGDLSMNRRVEFVIIDK
jgi:outer membrane protein OmpA-like peptidoglycan-associated protein